MKFYHASPARLAPGDVLRPGKRGYVCLGTSPAQARYWANVLKECRGTSDEWYIYEVDVPDDHIVEDCRGHYHFEWPGKKIPARDVLPHRDFDGEVNVYEPVAIVRQRSHFLLEGG